MAAGRQLVSPGRGDRAGRLRSCRPLANRLGAQAVYEQYRRERCAGAIGGAPGSPETTPAPSGWAHWPRPGASTVAAGADRARRCCLTIRRPFTWRGVRRRVRRADGPGAGLRRVVGPRCRARGGPGLFPAEDEAGERYWLYRAGDGEAQRRLAPLVPARGVRMSARHAELQVTSPFSFLRGAFGGGAVRAGRGARHRGASRRRPQLRWPASRAHEAAGTTGVRPVGCRFDLADGAAILAYPTDRPAYSTLCRLLSLGKKRAAGRPCLPARLGGPCGLRRGG